MYKVKIIAEAGVNHNGDINLAYRLCDAAKDAGADFIKFQTFKTEKIVTKTAASAEYQRKNTKSEASQYDMLKKLELKHEDFFKIKKYCDGIGIKFISTPDEEDSLDFLDSVGIDVFKIGSGEINNINFLRKVGGKRKEVILSTGMCYLGEIENAINILRKHGSKKITVLHCTTNYPCPIEEVNLKAMVTIRKAFKVPVGYSDHTLGIDVPIAATALGAEIIEKHLTLDVNMEGPDHRASLPPDEFMKMVKAIRATEKALGSGIKKPSPSEVKIKIIVRKYIVAAKKIKNGDIYTYENITTKRTTKGQLHAGLFDDVLGRKARKNYEIDEAIEL